MRKGVKQKDHAAREREIHPFYLNKFIKHCETN